jgi:FlaG/FlaF family flagellin (archaellin)
VKGISVIISTILIMATLMALLATAGIFFTNTFTEASSDAEERNRQLAECRDKSLAIDAASWNGSATELRLRSKSGSFQNVTVTTRPSLTTRFTSIKPGDLVILDIFTSEKPESVRASSQNCGISEETEVSS